MPTGDPSSTGPSSRDWIDGSYVPSSLEGDAVEAFLVGRHLSHRTMFERAEPHLAKAAALRPDHPVVVAYRAHQRRILFDDPAALLGHVAESLDSLSDPDRTLARGVTAQASGDWATALERITEFLSQERHDPYARHFRAVYLLDLGRPAEAHAELERLLSDCPMFTPALNHLGGALIAMGEVARAVATLRRFVEAEPDNYSARDSLADALEASGQFGEAIAELETAVSLEPTFAYGWRHLGDLRHQVGDGRGATDAYGSAIAAASLYGPTFRRDVEERLRQLDAHGE